MDSPTPGSKLTLPCGVTLNNRIAKAAMTEGLAGSRGRVSHELKNLYRCWSRGGAGLLLTGNVMVDRHYLERPGNLVVDCDYRVDLSALRELSSAGTESGNQLWMQISHPGRQCSRIVNNQPVAPSAVQLRILGNFARPRALLSDEIETIIERYARTAGAAQMGGFTGVQIHAAHGYLVSQFLSPLTNRRTDQWGGTLRNRARFLLEIVRATRRAVGPAFPVAVKLNSADFQKGGFTLQESCEVAGWLQQEKIDLLEVSGGTYEQPRLLGLQGNANQAENPARESTRRRQAYFLDYAQAIRKVVTIPLAVTGGIRDYQFMNNALRQRELDVVGLARPLCTEPELPGLMLRQQRDARDDEKHLRLGPGWLGPRSPIAAIRALNSQGAAAWYYRQIVRLGNDRRPDPELRFTTALLSHFRDEYRIGLQRRHELRTED